MFQFSISKGDFDDDRGEEWVLGINEQNHLGRRVSTRPFSASFAHEYRRQRKRNMSFIHGYECDNQRHLCDTLLVKICVTNFLMSCSFHDM